MIKRPLTEYNFTWEIPDLSKKQNYSKTIQLNAGIQFTIDLIRTERVYRGRNIRGHNPSVYLQKLTPDDPCHDQKSFPTFSFLIRTQGGASLFQDYIAMEDKKLYSGGTSRFIDESNEATCKKRSGELVLYIYIAVKEVAKVLSGEDARVASDFSSNLLGDDSSDFNFLICDQAFKVHKAIVSVGSSVLRKLIREHENEGQCTLEDISPVVFTELRRFIYKHSVNDLPVHAKELLAAAHKYNVVGLKSCCEVYLMDRLCEKNAEEVFQIAHQYACHRQLKLSSFSIIQNKFICFNMKLPSELADLPAELQKILDAKRAFYETFSSMSAKINNESVMNSSVDIVIEEVEAGEAPGPTKKLRFSDHLEFFVTPSEDDTGESTDEDVVFDYGISDISGSENEDEGIVDSDVACNELEPIDEAHDGEERKRDLVQETVEVTTEQSHGEAANESEVMDSPLYKDEVHANSATKSVQLESSGADKKAIEEPEAPDKLEHDNKSKVAVLPIESIKTVDERPTEVKDKAQPIETAPKIVKESAVAMAKPGASEVEMKAVEEIYTYEENGEQIDDAVEDQEPEEPKIHRDEIREFIKNVTSDEEV